MEEGARQLPPEIARTFRSWRTQARWLRIVHVTLLVAASAFSILAASGIDESYRRGFAIAAAISVGILSALDLGVKANGFRNAWRHMNAAMARFHSIPDFTPEQLITAYEEAETLIGDLPSGPRPEVPQGQNRNTEESGTLRRAS